MNKLIVDMIKTIAEWIDDISQTQGLTSSLKELLGDRPYDFIRQVMTVATKPVALTILAIFLVLELQKAVQKVEGSGGGALMGAEIVFKILLRAAFFLLIIDNMQDILDGIFEATSHVTGLIQGITVTPMEVQLTLYTYADSVSVYMDSPAYDSSLFYDLVLILLLVISMLVVQFARLTTTIFVYVRSIELFVLIAVSPIPAAMLPGQESRSAGIGFLKNFASVCLQGTVITIILRLFPTIIYTVLSKLDKPLLVPFDISATVIEVACLCVVLITAISSSGKWARAMTGLA